MEIRHAKPEDLPRIMEIYAGARDYMAATGNPVQWGATNWPPKELIRQDIQDKYSFVCIEQGKVVGVFFFRQGFQIDPTYALIEEGSWQGDAHYGVVHRLAGDGSVKGIGSFCLNWAFMQCGHLRVDTHSDNHIMQRLLERLGFVPCGIIHVQEDNDPRLAYEKLV